MHENGGVLVESISCHVDVFVVVENNNTDCRYYGTNVLCEIGGTCQMLYFLPLKAFMQNNQTLNFYMQ